jgi:stearoyl-CoA desaturase (Delta-9 desaturase)
VLATAPARPSQKRSERPKRDAADKVDWRSSAPFLVFHLVPLLVLVTGVHRGDVALLVALYLGRVVFITGGYHRYFAHRSYRLGRPAQFLVAFGGLTAVQKGPLWWAANHRAHHRYTDTDRDPHSPQKGFFWSHMGWILSGRHSKVDYAKIPDFAKYPELRFLDRNDWIGPWALGLVAYLIGGWSGLVVGFFGSTVLLWHATFCVNSVAHVFGRRRYDTNDTSTNSVFVAVVTLGEGWHNNHHHCPTAALHSHRWWELDPTFAVLRVGELLGIVKNLRRPSPARLAMGRVSAPRERRFAMAGGPMHGVDVELGDHVAPEGLDGLDREIDRYE